MSCISIGGLLRRPEAGAALGLIAVLIFFAIFGGLTFLKPAGMASWLNVAANPGVIAIPLGLLMISGEMDISVGAMVPFGAMTVAVVSGHYGLPIWAGVACALSFGLIVGLVNGILVVKTAVPSLIVTLGSLFAVQGIVLGLTVLITKSTSVALTVEGPAKLILGDFLLGGQVMVMVLWWLALTALYVFFVHFSAWGNWISAMGGDKVSARNAGIPTDRLRILLFVLSATSAAFLGMCQAILCNSTPLDVLHDITLEVRPGEVLCLLGDKGAGKLALIRLLSGVHQPTTGRIEMDGAAVASPPRAAQEAGISTVHQFGGTFPLMSIGRSFFVGVEPTKGWGPFRIYDRKRANAIAVKAVQDMGITRITDGDRLVGGLSGGERQSLAIARAVHFGARVLILDEPTAALGVKQATHVLRIVNEAKRRGLAVIFITHQVMHAMAVGDHFAVLIRGAVAADFRKGEKTREEIADLMAGGASMASLEAEIEGYMASYGGHPPPPEH